MTAPSAPDPPEAGAVLRFRLFVSGDSPRSARAVESVRRLGEDSLGGRYEVEVVDVLRHPERAEEDRILATPTLVKHAPPPDRRVMGDLSDLDTVLKVLVAGGERGEGPGDAE